MPRIPALDGIRGISILMVLIFHATGYRITGFGGMGVDLFFLLSGFLITHLLLAERVRAGAINLRAFVMRRALRLLPALWLTVAAVLAVTAASYPPDDFQVVVGDALAALTYTSNWVPIITQTPNRLLGHTWSLSVEVQFYIAWAVLAVWIMPRLTAKQLFIVLAAAPVILGAWTAWIFQNGATLAHMVYGFDTRSAPMFAGAALAVLLSMPEARVWCEVRLRRKPWMAPTALVALLVMALAFGSTLPWILLIYAPGLALLGVLVLADVMLVPEGQAARLLSWKPLTALGTISYGLYLCHFPLMRFAEQFLADGVAGGPVSWLACFVAAPLLALLSWRFVEQPVLRLKSGVARAESVPAQ